MRNHNTPLFYLGGFGCNKRIDTILFCMQAYVKPLRSAWAFGLICESLHFSW
eukprot:COSAG01_NODE_90_length_27307_cov_734.166458_31_plen_52_part_00